MDQTIIMTVASVDNFDMLQSHAAVYHGSNHCSYHVQLVQPNVHLNLDQPTSLQLTPSKHDVTFTSPSSH